MSQFAPALKDFVKIVLETDLMESIFSESTPTRPVSFGLDRRDFSKAIFRSMSSNLRL